MAQAQNWGKDTSPDYLQTMRAIVQEICLNSYETKLNMWDVICTFRKRGDLYKIGADRRESSILNKKDGLKYQTMMANYFSVGECAKIGFDFEIKRTASKCGNICRYACSGIKLLCCRCCWWKPSESIPLK
jgi:diacylglycerol kinase (ATP)